MEISRVIRRYSYWEILLEYSIVTIVLGCVLALTISVDFLRSLQSNRFIILVSDHQKNWTQLGWAFQRGRSHSAVLGRNFASARVADLSLELRDERSSSGYQQLFHQTLTSSSSEFCDQCSPKSGNIRYQTNYSSPPRFVGEDWQ